MGLSGNCSCVGGPPEYGKCNACGAEGQHYNKVYGSQIPITPGWVCPKCGSIYAPYTPECSRCNSQKVVY